MYSKIKLGLIAFLGFSTSVLSEEITKKVRIDGGTNYIKISPTTEKITLYGISKGNLTLPFQITGTVPAKTKITASAAVLDDDAEKILEKPKRFWKIELDNPEDIAQSKTQCVELSAGEGEEPPKEDEEDKLTPEMFPPTSSPICDLFSEEDKKDLRKQLEETFGGEWTLGNVCGYLVSVSNNPDLGGKDQWCGLYDWYALLGLGINCFPSSFFATEALQSGALISQSKNLVGLLRKDACNSKNKQYLLKVEVNFSKVSPEAMATQSSLLIRIRELKFKGSMATSIKPVSEGRYAPRPLAIMSWLNTLCGNSLTVTKWKSLKPQSTVQLPIYSFLIYKHLIVALAVADKVLTGGQGVFELSDGYNAYGVCLKLDRRRQKVNGYP